MQNGEKHDLKLKIQEADCNLIRATHRWRRIAGESVHASSFGPEATQATQVGRNHHLQQLQRTAKVLLLCFQWSSSPDPWRSVCKTPDRRQSSASASSPAQEWNLCERFVVSGIGILKTDDT
eukprot:g31097.t1